MYRAVIVLQAIVIIICAALLCGCSQPGPITNCITGHVYLDGHAVSGAYVEAASVNGTDRVNTTTDDGGAYTLNINAETKYNLTATWQGLRHIVWPVYLPGDVNTYDINLTSTPTSTIEGSGYTMGGPKPGMYDHKRLSGFKMGVTPAHGNTSITTRTDDNGNYTLVVEPNILYNMTGGVGGMSPPDYIIPIAVFNYRNDGRIMVGYYDNIIVGPNETALVDYVIYVP